MAAVHPIKRPQAAAVTLEELTNAWIETKRAEEIANKQRLEIEQQMLALHPAPEQGSETVELANGLKLVLTGKLGYRADMDALMTVCMKLPEELRPLKTETKLDETKAKWIRANNSDAWRVLAEAVEVKPMKVGVSVKV